MAALLPADGEDPSQRIARQAAGRWRSASWRTSRAGRWGPARAGCGASRWSWRRRWSGCGRRCRQSAARQLPRSETAPLALASEWMAEAALEAHGHALMLMTHPEYEVVAGIRALHPAETLARAAERVLNAAEMWAAHDGLLELEIEAAYWFSERWSAEDDDGERGLRSVQRRMEWALAERPTLARGEPVLAALLSSHGGGRLAQAAPAGGAGPGALRRGRVPGAGRRDGRRDGPRALADGRPRAAHPRSVRRGAPRPRADGPRAPRRRGRARLRALGGAGGRRRRRRPARHGGRRAGVRRAAAAGRGAGGHHRRRAVRRPHPPPHHGRAGPARTRWPASRSCAT